MIELLKRPEGARSANRRGHGLAASHDPRRHLGRAQEKLGSPATRNREVSPNKTGAKGSSTTYRIVA